MEINYPIFVKDQDGWMMLLNNSEQIQIKLEYNDIYDKEYDAWDVNGRVLELYLDKKEIKVRLVADEPAPHMLKEAILNYAEIGKPEVPFPTNLPDDDVVNLFNAVEEHIENK